MPPIVFTLALASAALAQTYTMKTFAGGALPENVPGASASLGNVYGIAIDNLGNVFLALGDYHIVVRVDANTGVVTRVAGTGMAGYNGDNIPAATAQLSSPTGLAVDAAGNLYIADSGNSRLRMVSGGAITTIAGNGALGYAGDNGPPASAQFNGLADLAIDSAGNLYIADFYNQVIRLVSQGVITTVAGNGTYGAGGDNLPATSVPLAGPSGIALDSAGNLYIAEGYNNKIRKVSNGIITTVAGTGTAGFTGDKAQAVAATLQQPTDVAVDSAGNLYIADYGNCRIRKVTVSTGVITTVAGNGAKIFNGDIGGATSLNLASPQRIAVDAAANFYIVDAGRIRKVANGTATTMAGGGSPAGEGGPAASAQLLSPEGLAVDAAGTVYISDEGTGRILKVSSGVLARVAGGGPPGGANVDNIPATSALLSAPYGLAVDSTGNNIYLADSTAARVREISFGVISTVAGGGSVLGDNGPPTKAQLSDPLGIAVDPGGNLYIADFNRVRLVSNGTINTIAGNGSAGYQGDGGVATAAELASPNAVAVDSSGNLYIADTGNNRVRLVSGGVITTVAGNGTYGFTGSNGNATSATLGAPAGVIADSSGNLYITDAYRVLKLTKGKIASIAGLAGPQGVAVDAAGNVYVANPSAHRVYVLTPSGTTCAVAVAPTSLQSSASGGNLTIAIQAGSSCPWAIESLPAWTTLSGTAFGAGPATVTLAVAANPDAPRSATILIGGQSVVLAQAGNMTILGQVTLSSGNPLPGVTIVLNGGTLPSATTDSGGNFSLENLNSVSTYTVTPSLAGYSFVPPSLTFANASANPVANFVAWPQPVVGGLGPGFASLVQPIPTSFAAREIVSIYGANLCSTATGAAPTYPDRLAACFVQVDGANIRVFYASLTQINVVLPQTLALGAHQLVVQRYTDTTYKTLAAQSQPFTFTVVRISLAFVERTDAAATVLLAQYADGGFAGSTRPLHAGDPITLYLTGLGRTAQTFAEGAAPKTASNAVESVQVFVQGQPAQVTYAGVQPQYPGFDQVNVKLPSYTLTSGQSSVTFQITAPATGQTLNYTLAAR
ncbi:MAG TPA: carboxypeptidase regulatory-like domain-containing protein [Bryobacteraceae bacterium]|nr:carboxypeptidase regulatory-like domain-containing protein [Bryobacteraceae bacterium]